MATLDLIGVIVYLVVTINIDRIVDDLPQVLIIYPKQLEI